MISRRNFIKLTATGMAGILTSGCSPWFRSKRTMPNVIFIIIDALRADHLGCYGYHRDTSPQIDAFAAKSILFRNVFTDVPKTCPSVTSFLTGRYIQKHGVLRNNMDWDLSTQSLTEVMPQHYKKVAIVSNPIMKFMEGHERGFDQYTFTTRTEVTSKALQWFSEESEKASFFLWLHYLDPHGPYTPPPEYHEIFVNDRFYDSSQKVTLDYTPKKGLNENYVLGAVPKYQRLGNMDERDYYIAQYDAEIRYVDSEVGRLLNYLKTRKLTDNTIVIISADHGESLGEDNYYFEHGMLVNEGSIHIPLIINHPEVKEPLVINSLLQNIDLAPTVLNELGTAFSTRIDGIDFSTSYHDRKPDIQLRNFIYSCTPHEYESFFETIRTMTNKLVRKNENVHSFYRITNGELALMNNHSAADQNEIRESMSLFEKFKRGRQVQRLDRKLSTEEMEELKALGYIF